MFKRSWDVLKQLEAAPASQSATLFQWKRKQDGYEIVFGVNAVSLLSSRKRRREAYLAEKTSAKNQQFEWYSPAVEHPALFREAADLDLSPESLAAFVNRWGPLDENVFRFVRGSLNELKRPMEEVLLRSEDGLLITLDNPVGIPLRQLQWSVAAWDACNSGSMTKVMTFFRQTPQNEWAQIWQGEEGESLHVLRGGHAIGARRGRFRDILVRSYQAVTNVWLQRASSPMLLHNPDNSFELRFVPHDLMGFLWVQFAEAIAGDKKHRPCDSCSRWMEISPDHGRPEKTYCSSACKQRAYRTRLKSAPRAKRKVRG